MITSPLFNIAVAYLLGSLPFGVILGRFIAGVDVRKHGSGNIGATNVLRTLGLPFAIGTLILDVSKGIVAVVLARRAGLDLTWTIGAGLAVVVGHNWTIFLGFNGGKGIATTVGVLLMIVPQIALGFMVLWALVIAATRFVSLGSIVAATALPFMALVFREPSAVVVGCFVLGLMAVWRHKQNIQRLLAGKEHKLGQRVK